MSVATTDLWYVGAADLAEAIRSRRTSSREVIEAHLRRIEAVNPAVNAVTVLLGEQALEAAKAADRALVERGSTAVPRRPVHRQREHRPRRYVDRAWTEGPRGLVSGPGRAHCRADAGLLGRSQSARTNLPDFAIGWHTDSELRARP